MAGNSAMIAPARLASARSETMLPKTKGAYDSSLNSLGSPPWALPGLANEILMQLQLACHPNS